jgi:hypothetical protein
MRLTFTKRGGKTVDLVIGRPGHPDTAIACPKQGIIPHDMVHYAVESIVAQPGFLSLVAEGGPAGFDTGGGDDEEAIERLVEVFQAEMWSGRVSVADLLATYRHACEARGHAAFIVTGEAVDAIRTRLDQLTDAWSRLPLNDSLSLDL